jgi:flagellin
MRRQIRGLSQASNNAQDGVSWCQIADGALDEVSNMISRAKELAVQAANDTLTDDDRSYINEEMQKMASEIDRTHAATEFNNIHIFSDDGYAPNTAAKAPAENSMSVVLPNGSEIKISLSFIGADGQKATPSTVQATGQDTSYADTEYAKFVQKAASNAVANLYANFPNLFNTSASSGIQVGLDLHQKNKGDVLATASIKLTSSGDSTLMQYSMFVDTIDYPLSEWDTMSNDKKANLASTIAHEMTHLAMYDTLTGGMLGGQLGTKFPQWFVEGVAQTSSGDGGWVTPAAGNTAAIQDFNKKLDTNVYGAGYLAAMYLGYAVSASDTTSPSTAVTSGNIKAGLDKLMAYIAADKNRTLSDAIKDLTGYDSLSDFEKSFKDSTAKSDTLNPLAFTNTLLTNTGSGAGSLFGDLSATEAALFAPNKLSDSGSNYAINASNTKFGNAFGTGVPIPDKQPGKADGEGSEDGYSNLLKLQVGSETSSMNQIDLKRFDIRLSSLTEGGTFDTSTRDLALQTIETVNVAGTNVARVRSYYGALQNRLEHTIKNLDNVVENTTSAESRIRDTDMAEEMVRYSNNNILAQAGQAMLAQANQTNQGVLSLLQ